MSFAGVIGLCRTTGAFHATFRFRFSNLPTVAKLGGAVMIPDGQASKFSWLSAQDFLAAICAP